MTAEDYYSSLHILKLTDMIWLELIKFGYTITKRQQATPLQKLMDDRGGKKMHCYPMQRKQLPNIQKHTSKAFNRSFICKAIQEFNSLPNNMKDSTTTSQMVRKSKNSLH